jgi:hypothetical protein
MARRKMVTTNLCQICGQEAEDTFHVFVQCPQARALWLAMKEEWDLPADDLIKPVGTEWLIQLLTTILDSQCSRTILVLWRIWHNHNEMTHEKPRPSIEGSHRFLLRYANTLALIKQYPGGDIAKGKMIIDQGCHIGVKSQHQDGRKKEQKRWTAPEPGHAKLNTDGAFLNSSEAGIGMVLNHEGKVVVAAYQEVQQCQDATEAELMTIEEGIQLSLMSTNLPFLIETNCSEACELIQQTTPNTSIYAFRISVIRELIREGNISVMKVSRDSNTVSHELARIGRIRWWSNVWFSNLPPEVSRAVDQDCNPPIA